MIREKGHFRLRKTRGKEDGGVCVRDIGSSSGQSMGKVKGDRVGKAGLAGLQRSQKPE